jgi:hypothetical protein
MADDFQVGLSGSGRTRSQPPWQPRAYFGRHLPGLPMAGCGHITGRARGV